MRWKTLELLGEGGYGKVFRVQLDDGQVVAIKRLSTPCSPSQLSSLRREGEIAASLVHPNIVALLDVYADDQQHPCLIMELVSGVDLDQLIDVARLPIAAAVYVARSVLQALVHAHESARIIHRDISPHNVLISWQGDVKVADFGVAKSLDRQSLSGKIRGKLQFMSPEQYKAIRVDARSDLFAVGLTLYELLAGYSPYGARPDKDKDIGTDTVRDTDDAIYCFMAGNHPLPPLAERCPELPPAVCAVVMRLLEHDPANRYQSAREALDALPDWPHGKVELVTTVRHLRNLRAFEPPVPAPRPRIRRLLVSVAMLAFAIGVLSTFAVWRLRGQAIEMPRAALDESPGIVPAPQCTAPDPLPAPAPTPDRSIHDESEASKQVQETPPHAMARKRQKATKPQDNSTYSAASARQPAPAQSPASKHTTAWNQLRAVWTAEQQGANHAN